MPSEDECHLLYLTPEQQLRPLPPDPSVWEDFSEIHGGERIVSMVEHQGFVLIATTRRVFKLMPTDWKFVPLKFTAEDARRAAIEKTEAELAATEAKLKG